MQPVIARVDDALFGCLVFGIIKDKEWSDARRCDYTGQYFCSACHWGSSAVVPARVVHNWDLATYPVSQASLQQLRVTARRPLINLEKLNPRLFSLVHELNLVRRLRQGSPACAGTCWCAGERRRTTCCGRTSTRHTWSTRSTCTVCR
ncbi:hypothetical protein NQ318_016079 [Aromia moschata]|uniref:Rubicon Homology domain-containing protein n=1 Tax=Aromia moschata TaxID=1265417 RepID=A0AAV8X4N3_9CUCU|nr:hypothetical protein NQ318_016079 [Aromia moschata]